MSIDAIGRTAFGDRARYAARSSRAPHAVCSKRVLRSCFLAHVAYVARRAAVRAASPTRQRRGRLSVWAEWHVAGASQRLLRLEFLQTLRNAEPQVRPASDAARIVGRNSTAPDANCMLHGDLNNNGEIADDTIGGYAFHEHAGRGVRGEQTASPFYQFWFDDNWIARYVSEAYDRPQPSACTTSVIHPLAGLGGDNSRWTPYPESSPHVDQIASERAVQAQRGRFRRRIGGLERDQEFERRRVRRDARPLRLFVCGRSDLLPRLMGDLVRTTARGARGLRPAG